MSWKPDGYPSVSPYLIIDGAEAMIAFCEKVFGAERLRRYNTPDGRIAHAELRIADSVVMLADATPEYGPATANLHVYVPDVDAAYRRALDAGATSIQEPKRKDDPDRRCGVAIAGIQWWMATQEG